MVSLVLFLRPPELSDIEIAGSNQYHNMMPINTNSSNPQNTQAYGQQDFQNDTTKMDTMNDYHYGINNEKIPSTFQSIQEAPFPSRQHTLGLNHSNSLSTIFDSPYDETHIQAGSNPSLDANQIGKASAIQPCKQSVLILS